MTPAVNVAIDLTEQGLVPDTFVRHGIRRLLRQRLADLKIDDCEALARSEDGFAHEMEQADIAPVPHKANEQHYEVPAAFFQHVLGRHRKYSCCYWPSGVDSLSAAEAAALEVTCERAGLRDGMDILELGCGWGSLTLWVAERFPASKITAVSNSRSQGAHIREEASRRQLGNVRVVTADMNYFDAGQQFDRVVSVEMLEHMRNYRLLFRRIHSWLRPGGQFFMHIFCHRAAPYAFLDQGPTDWMSRHFFSGGIMPSDDLPLRFQDHLRFVQRWRWSGCHYERTANAWLENMDANRDAIWPLLETTYGADSAAQWWTRWRIFFMACAELFGFQSGQQWWVSHYLYERPSA